MSHGPAPKPTRQGGHATPCECPPIAAGKSDTVNTVVSTPGLSSSRGDHVTPIGGKGTVGKPGANVKPPAWEF